MSHEVNTLRPRQHGRRFADDTFIRIFLNENVWILIKISLKFVLQGPINNIPALVQIMAWRRSDDKPLSEPMMITDGLLTHTYIRPQWVKFRQNIGVNRCTCCPFHKQWTWFQTHPQSNNAQLTIYIYIYFNKTGYERQWFIWRIKNEVNEIWIDIQIFYFRTTDLRMLLAKPGSPWP